MDKYSSYKREVKKLSEKLASLPEGSILLESTIETIEKIQAEMRSLLS
jgi:hypothetical protein